ncbi:hypothetical protein [Pedobacter alluvionis]|uniref:Uncharacterized protein n=1 Tax=Pedobacter alluvionis TaxID=475253 RepID=A0A497Y594_9SPHI|nr:hypothetical protein [Pedobacter alluvionis]RLJ77340.1 hypothetical protein BCL90_2425 [Pedobacter alluvionis]TFB33438.1 hypothetical protein E3V97_05165 [Pedobacter alluvionis]
MKALIDLTNTEKARLLHDLFPEEMPLFIEHLKKVCEDFNVNKEQYAKKWENGFMGFGYWFSLSEETARILKRHAFNMAKSSRVFSDQLFFTNTSIFVNDRIIKYAEHISANEKFKIAVELIYT